MLLAIYIGATVFGAGVTIPDLLGVFSSLTGGDDGDADDGDGDADDGDGDDAVSIAGHDRVHHGNAALRILTAFRSLVYFALGFGPVGWFATTQYSTAASTLAWSVPVGLGVMVGTRLLRSFMRRDLSSDIRKEDLIMESGVVTVSIGKGKMGKVRISIGGMQTERFARAKGDDSNIAVGTRVSVTDATDDCVYVEEE